jgi:hypothetical protein
MKSHDQLGTHQNPKDWEKLWCKAIGLNYTQARRMVNMSKLERYSVLRNADPMV